MTDSWIIFNLMNKASSPIAPDDMSINVQLAQSAPRKRQKRIISRKTDHSEKSVQGRKHLQRTPRVNEFITPRAVDTSHFKTPDSRQEEVVPRLSFNDSEIKSFITYQPLWRNREGCEANIQSARELPKVESRTDREAEIKHEYFSKKIENLKAELEIRNQEIEVLEEDRQRLRKNNQELQKGNAALEAERKQLRLQIQNGRQENLKLTNDKKKLEREKDTLEKKIVALEKCSNNQSWSLQSNRERYLEREIQELRQRLGKSKSQLEKLLENQVNRHKDELFNSLRTISALKINNDCLQKKIFQISQKPEPKFSPNEEYMKLRNKYKKFLAEYRTLRKEHDQLQELYDELRSKCEKIDKSETLDEDTSLDLSNLS